MEDDSENFEVLTACLLQDVIRCYGELDKATSDEDYKFWARMTARAVFAAVGGICEALCAQAFAAETHKVAAGEISIGKLAVLAGESYFVDDSGEVRFQTIRIKFLHHVLFALKSYAEAQGVVHRTKKDGAGWESFRAAVITRDKITHPKKAESLQLNRDQMKQVREAFVWFHNEIAAIFSEKGMDVSPFVDE